MTLTGPPQLRLLVATLLAFAAMVGFLAGIEPVYAVGLSLAAVFALIVLSDLALGVCVFTTVVFIESLPGLGSLSAAKGLGGLLVLSWIAHSLHTHRRVELTRAHPLLSLGLLVMVAWVFASALWAREPSLAIVAGQSWALNALLVPIIYAAMRTPKDVGRVYAVFVIGTLISAAVGLVGAAAPSGSDAGRLEGAGINANQLGGLLVIATVLAGVLAARRRTGTRGLWLAATVCCFVALAFTLSRGALVGMAVCLIVAPFVAGPRRRLPMLMMGALAAITVALAIMTLVPAADAERLFTDASGSGRTDIWQVGWRMVEDNPALGVGAANFPENTIRYLLQPGVIQDDFYLVDIPKVPHNIYLQALAEVGPFGLALFLSIILAVLWCGLRAAANFAAAEERARRSCTRAGWWWRRSASWRSSSSRRRCTPRRSGCCSPWVPRCSRSPGNRPGTDAPSRRRHLHAVRQRVLRRRRAAPGGARKARPCCWRGR